MIDPSALVKALSPEQKDMLRGVLKDSGQQAADSSGSATLSGVSKGVKTGALLGSIVPGLGNLIGAVGGGLVGGVAGAFKDVKAAKEDEEKDTTTTS